VRTIRSAIVEPRPAARRVPAPIAAPPPAVASAGPAADLSVDLGRGLCLRNPLLVASGTFGYGVEYADVVDIERLGAICCKGTTLRPRQGNRPPRVTETPAGMLNSIGLQNPGVDAVLERYAAQWAGWQVPVIVNVAGESIEDYVQVVRKLDLVPGIAGVELNISCPNVGKGGLQFAIDQDAAAAVTRAVRRATELPLIVKLSPNVADIRRSPLRSRTRARMRSRRSTRSPGWRSVATGPARSWATRTAASPARQSSRSRSGSSTRSPRSWASRSSRSAA